MDDAADDDSGGMSTAKWNRPPAPPLNPAREALAFHQMELESYIGSPMVGMPGTKIQRDRKRKSKDRHIESERKPCTCTETKRGRRCERKK